MIGLGRRVVLGVVVAAAMSLPFTAASAEDEPSTPLLPDLRMIAPEEIMGPSTGLLFGFTDLPVVVEGCNLDERVRRGAGRCLRFDTIVGNYGEGTFEVAYEVANQIDRSKNLATAYQHIYRADGSHIKRFATKSEYHPTHIHFHIHDFYRARLWSSSASGGRSGTAPVAGGAKNGFCPADIDQIEEGEQTEPAHYTCFTDYEYSGAQPRQVVGISPGWMDVYGYTLPDQFVEITGIPDGYYALVIDLDPNDVFVESDETNNGVCVVLKLQAASAELLDPMPPC